MTEPRLFDVMCLDNRCLHRMAYAEWGDAANPKLLLCLHGLTRQGRDFDTLARALAGEYRVVCHDVVGRGRSDWLADPMGNAIPQYVADMVTLLARLDAGSVDLVGTIVVRRVRRDSIRSEARWPWASGCNTAGPVAVMHIHLCAHRVGSGDARPGVAAVPRLIRRSPWCLPTAMRGLLPLKFAG